MYSLSVRLLHKILAMLIVVQILFGFAYAWNVVSFEWIITLHKSFGVIILTLTLLLLFVRLFSRKPAYTTPLPFWQHAVARIVHLGIYISALAMALSGLIGYMLMGYHWNIFFIAPLPDFLKTNQELGSQIFSYHYIFATILSVLVLSHIIAALYHQFIVKDNLLIRMK